MAFHLFGPSRHLAVTTLILTAFSMPQQVQAEPSSRRLDFEAAVGQNGVSEEIQFEIPSATRSVTFIAKGQESSLYALYSFVQQDGIERIGIDSPSPAQEMNRLYRQEEISYAPSAWPQSTRLGTFTATYPYLQTDNLVAGTAKVRFVSTDAAARSIKVSILMPKEEPANILRINLISMSPLFNPTRTTAIQERLSRIFSQAGIKIVVNRRLRFSNSPFRTLTDFNEPQETPTSQAADLASTYGAPLVGTGALNVYTVDGLQAAGISLGIPGPPDPESYYYGVVILRSSSASEYARVLAHEICHYLGLPHLSNRAVSGQVYLDPFSDTRVGEGNLMDSGLSLTPQQVYTLLRSPMLVAQ